MRWGRVEWAAVGAMAGGAIGGRFASLVKPAPLRPMVVAIGIGAAVIFVLRG